MGKVFVISAPSGAGKSSLIKAVIQKDDNASVSISHTTREMRKEEADRENYYFVDDSAFDNLVLEGAFVEWAEVFDYKYGTSFFAINDLLKSGKDVFLDIDWQGARQIKEIYSDAVLIFILPPSLDELKSRLQSRGDDSELIEYRMEKASSEISHKDEFGYIIINSNFNDSLNKLLLILKENR